MKQLTNDEIIKNKVDTIKVIGRENKQAFFRYDEEKKGVLFLEEMEEELNIF